MTRHLIFPQARHRVQRPTRGSGCVSAGDNHAADRAADAPATPSGDAGHQSASAHSPRWVSVYIINRSRSKSALCVVAAVPCRHLSCPHVAYLCCDWPLHLSHSSEALHAPSLHHSAQLQVGEKTKMPPSPSQASAEPHTSSSHGCKHTAALELQTMSSWGSRGSWKSFTQRFRLKCSQMSHMPLSNRAKGRSARLSAQGLLATPAPSSRSANSVALKWLFSL